MSFEQHQKPTRQSNNLDTPTLRLPRFQISAAAVFAAAQQQPQPPAPQRQYGYAQPQNIPTPTRRVAAPVVHTMPAVNRAIPAAVNWNTVESSAIQENWLQRITGTHLAIAFSVVMLLLIITSGPSSSPLAQTVSLPALANGGGLSSDGVTPHPVITANTSSYSATTTPAPTDTTSVSTDIAESSSPQITTQSLHGGIPSPAAAEKLTYSLS